jgi:hypothetical protein
LQLPVLLQPSTVTHAYPFVNTSPAPLRWCCGPEPADPLQIQSRSTIVCVCLRLAAGGSATIYEQLFCYALVWTGAGFRPAHRVPALDDSPALNCAPSASVGMSAYYFTSLRYFELRALSHGDFCMCFVLLGVYKVLSEQPWAESWIHAPDVSNVLEKM